MKTKALALLCLVDFMVILDSQIVILGIPPIQEDLGFSADGVQWVLSAYLISFGGLLLLGGRAGDLLGRRRVLLARPRACFGALEPAVRARVDAGRARRRPRRSRAPAPR